MSIIAAGTTTTTALSSTGNTDGTLQFQVNGTTPSVTLNTLGAVGVGSTPAYGSSGQILTSAGSTAAPAWANAPAGGNTSSNIGYLNIPQNIQAGSYTLVLGDSGYHIYHALGAGAATYTIPANASVAYPIGSAITFVNMSATSISIAITSDTMYLSSAGTTGTRTLAQYGSATAIKLTSTTWLISGSGLT
jgi:hypothetical protein